ncbi:hypothetical protein NYE48_15115 [Paenibacillus sp. FSL M7-1455]|uniref:hypothetical protein n=1 Tax=Paenibacillus sp. FSL M7-1455 TaxID=2975316 RepID=UPI0030F82657
MITLVHFMGAAVRAMALERLYQMERSLVRQDRFTSRRELNIVLDENIIFGGGKF